MSHRTDTGLSHLDPTKLNRSTDLLRALAHPLRLRILSYIHTVGEVNVNKIYKDLDLEQSITSQHLKILRDMDLVTTRREGKYIYYKVRYEHITQLVHGVLGYFDRADEPRIATA